MSSWRWVFRCVPSARQSHRLCVAHSEGDAQPLYLLVYCQRGDASLHRWTARYCAIVVCVSAVWRLLFGRSRQATLLPTYFPSVTRITVCPSMSKNYFCCGRRRSRTALLQDAPFALCPPDCQPILTNRLDSSKFPNPRLTLQPTLNKPKLHIWFLLLYACSEL